MTGVADGLGGDRGLRRGLTRRCLVLGGAGLEPGERRLLGLGPVGERERVGLDRLLGVGDRLVALVLVLVLRLLSLVGLRLLSLGFRLVVLDLRLLSLGFRLVVLDLRLVLSLLVLSLLFLGAPAPRPRSRASASGRPPPRRRRRRPAARRASRPRASSRSVGGRGESRRQVVDEVDHSTAIARQRAHRDPLLGTVVTATERADVLPIAVAVILGGIGFQ